MAKLTIKRTVEERSTSTQHLPNESDQALLTPAPSSCCCSCAKPGPQTHGKDHNEQNSHQSSAFAFFNQQQIVDEQAENTIELTI